MWEISKLTDLDRHKLSYHWRMLAQAYEPDSFTSAEAVWRCWLPTCYI